MQEKMGSWLISKSQGLVLLTLVMILMGVIGIGAVVVLAQSENESKVYLPIVSAQGGGDASDSDVHAAIVGGRDATQTYSWMVSLQDVNGNNLNNNDYRQGHQCGGVLIAPRWILTAAHCFGDKLLANNPGSTRAIIGAYSLSNPAGAEVILAEKIIPHPSFVPSLDHKLGPFDIALVKLTSASSKQTAVFPIASYNKATYKIIGWGVWSVGPILGDIWRSSPDKLQELEVLEDSALPGFGQRSEHVSLYAVGESGAICDGDSGGPVVINNTVFGIANASECTSYSIFTDVQYFLNSWIIPTMQDNPTPGVCIPGVAAAMSNDCVSPGATSTPQPTQPPIDGIQVVNPSSYKVSPGEGFNPSLTIKVTSGQLNTFDYLHAIPEDNSNAFGAHPMQGVNSVVSTGNTYTFQVNTHPLFHMIAPQQTGSYQSVWRMHVNGQDVGPQIIIPIIVQTVNSPHPIDYWDAYYYTSKDLSGSVSHHTTFSDQYLFQDWGIGSPNSAIPVDNWSARFIREINFGGGDYHFHCQHDDGCRILIDGTTVLDAWWDSSFAGHDWTGTLTPGLHEVKVEYYDQGGDARLDVWWQGPGFLPRYPSCEPDQWCGDYWGNKTLSGSPPLTRNEGTGTLNVGWGTGSPGYNLPSDNFSAQFRHTLPFACGIYRFHVTADDGDRFYVDGVLKLDEWTYKGQYTTDVDVQLTEGNHALRIDYYENGGDTAMRLSWDQLTTCAPSAGNLVVSSGQTVFAATIQTSVTASGTTATVSSSEGFDVGDKVLFHQTQGTANAGKWEMAQILAKNGNSWTLDHALTNAYDNTNGRAQAVKVPHYTNVTIQSGGTLTALPWNGATGGILIFESDGNVAVDGAIDVTGKGFTGGAGSKRTLNHTGAQGESYTGPGTTCSSTGCNVQTNNAGGGGSGGVFAIGSGGGAGASYSTVGAQAVTGSASPGSTYGSAALNLIFIGSGGGGGYDDGSGGTAGGNGGNGGGIIFINAPNITVNGSIVADGAAGQGTANYSGGGGSGGSIYLTASSSLAVGTDKILARGGNGGVNTIGQSGGNGGAAGAGRIHIEYCNALSGSTNPPASVQQLNCMAPTSTPTNTPLATDTSTPMPTNTPVPATPTPVTCTGRITGLALFDLNAGQPVPGYNPIPNGATINLASLPSLFNLEAMTSGVLESVQFNVNGAIYLQNDAPYRSPEDTVAWSVTPGSYSLSATAFSQDNAAGAVCDTKSLTVNFVTPTNTSTNTPVPPTAISTATSTPASTPTPTPTNGVSGVELLTSPWHLVGNNSAAEAYQNIDPNVLQGRDRLKITYDLHGLPALGNDASAIIFDQPINQDWRYISLSNYGQNGLNGEQTVTIPLSAFPGLSLNAPVGTLHTRFWYSGPFVVDITSIVAYNSQAGTPVPSPPTAIATMMATFTVTPIPTNTATYTPIAPTSTKTPTSQSTLTSTPQATNISTPTSTPTPTSGVNGVELLTSSWHLAGKNGAAEAYQSVAPNVLQGKNTLRVTYNLHGLQALGNDASAIIFDQPINQDWRYISLSNYGKNGLNGVQTVEIPLSAFPGLNLNANVGTLHTRFWYSKSFVVDITSIMAYFKVVGASAEESETVTKELSFNSNSIYLPLIASGEMIEANRVVTVPIHNEPSSGAYSIYLPLISQ